MTWLAFFGGVAVGVGLTVGVALVFAKVVGRVV